MKPSKKRLGFERRFLKIEKQKETMMCPLYNEKKLHK